MRFKERTSFVELCQWAKIERSSLYYQSHPGKRGKQASSHTIHNGILVENNHVVEDIRMILGQDYCVYGYQIMTSELRDRGYHINKKKVYRLMNESRLLCGKRIKTQGKREWVRFRRIIASKPMEYLCLDIKYVWVQGEGRWCYQLAIIDVYSRFIIGWLFQQHLRQNDVIAVMRNLDLRFGLKGVVIRNDNGSQFIAHKVRQALQAMEARQEFTHVATPEENAYIEAFHSIQQRELIDRFIFASYYDAKSRIEKYMLWYNCIRKHGKLGGITPLNKWKQGVNCSTVRRNIFPVSVLSRSADTFENWIKNQPLGTNLDKIETGDYLCLTGEQENTMLVANHFVKNVQRIGG